jgi:hypothetical protein
MTIETATTAREGPLRVPAEQQGSTQIKVYGNPAIVCDDRRVFSVRRGIAWTRKK